MSDRSRDILGRVKQFVVVAIVTVLIWLLAESESVRVEKVPVDLSFRPEQDATRLVVTGPEFGPVIPAMITLQGPAARVDALAGKIRSKLISLQPGIDGVPADPGRRTIDLRDVLRGLPSVRESRVAIAAVDPEVIPVEVDNLVTREVRVKVVAPDGQFLEGAPEPSPATVSLKLPEAAAAKLPPDLELPARIAPSDLANRTEGRRITLTNVAVELPDGIKGMEGVRLTPPAVNVGVTLRSRVTSYTLPTVPVHIRLAPTETAMWDIQIPPESRLLTDVAVSGPREDIDQIRSGKLKPIAYVSLSFEELEKAAAAGQPIEKEPIFSELPTSVKFDVKQAMIKVLVKRRETAPAAGTVPPPKAPGGG
jgi:hypothetical protein